MASRCAFALLLHDTRHGVLYARCMPDVCQVRKRRLQSVMIVEQCNEIDANGLAEVLSDHAGHQQLVDKIKFLEELGKYGGQPQLQREFLYMLITKPNLPDVATIPLTYWQPIFERVAELLRNSSADLPTFSERQTLAVLEKLQEFEMDVEFGLLEEYEDSKKLLEALSKVCTRALATLPHGPLVSRVAANASPTRKLQPESVVQVRLLLVKNLATAGVRHLVEA
jgi:hypothetical protein